MILRLRIWGCTERLINLLLNIVTSNFVATYVFFGTASSFTERTESPLRKPKRNVKPFCFFVVLRLLGAEWYLVDHLRASQPACGKSTIYLCGIYTTEPVTIWKWKGSLSQLIHVMNETNCRIAHNLGILLMNSNCFAIFFQRHSTYVCSDIY